MVSLSIKLDLKPVGLDLSQVFPSPIGSRPAMGLRPARGFCFLLGVWFAMGLLARVWFAVGLLGGSWWWWWRWIFCVAGGWKLMGFCWICWLDMSFSSGFLWVSVGVWFAGGCGGFVGWVAVVVVSFCWIRWVFGCGFFLQFRENFFTEEIYGGKWQLVISENIYIKYFENNGQTKKMDWKQRKTWFWIKWGRTVRIQVSETKNKIQWPNMPLEMYAQI